LDEQFEVEASGDLSVALVQRMEPQEFGIDGLQGLRLKVESALGDGLRNLIQFDGARTIAIEVVEGGFHRGDELIEGSEFEEADLSTPVLVEDFDEKVGGGEGEGNAIEFVVGELSGRNLSTLVFVQSGKSSLQDFQLSRRNLIVVRLSSSN